MSPSGETCAYGNTGCQGSLFQLGAVQAFPLDLPSQPQQPKFVDYLKRLDISGLLLHVWLWDSKYWAIYDLCWGGILLVLFDSFDFPPLLTGKLMCHLHSAIIRARVLVKQISFGFDCKYKYMQCIF